MSEKKEFFCLACKTRFENEMQCNDHGCFHGFMMIDGKLSIELSDVLKLKRTRWRRFCDKFWSIDWSWGLAFSGVVVINMVLLPHFHLSFGETIIESFALGLALPRLIK